MITLRKIAFNQKITEHIATCLAAGNSLGKLAATTLRFDKGSIWAAIPSALNLSSLDSYNHGIGISKKQTHSALVATDSTPEDLLLTEISSFLESQGGVVIFENSLKTASDSLVKENKDNLHLITQANEVYYCLSPEDLSSKQTIEKTLKRASNKNSVQYVGFFTKGSSDQLKNGEMYQLLEETSGIVFGAFDRESFLLWKKSE